MIGINEGVTKSGNTVALKNGTKGRKAGSKNRVTVLKLLAEEAIRSNNATKILEVCNLIVDQALAGDKPSQKLVWQSVVSNGVTEDKATAEKVEIKIGTMTPTEVIINPKELNEEEIQDVG